MTEQELINHPGSPERICVYCASSTQSDAEYRDAAYESGQLLAEEGFEIIYGGGALGSMGALADGH